MKLAKRITSIALAATTAMSLCSGQMFFKGVSLIVDAVSYSDEVQYLDNLCYTKVDEDEDGIYDYLGRVHIKRASKIIARKITEMKIESSLS